MKHKKIFIFILLVVIVLLGIVVYFYLNPKINKENKAENLQKEEPIETKELTIVDENSFARNYAVMINNHRQARINHAGLQDAYIVYEAIVEGGLTRMMAIYKDKESARIGSVRSARHYFLDYALENDAIYVHFGWSPQAQSDIGTLHIDNINGLYDNIFFRDTTLGIAYEHTAFTSMKNIREFVRNKGYRTTSNQKLLLNYNVDEVDISKKEDAIVANNIDIVYSSYMTTSYIYDAQSKVYLRFVNGENHMTVDENKIPTQITAKNIIITDINNYSIDNKDRQTLENIGTGNGYYITNGYAVAITWTKSSRNSQTIYTYIDGTEIDVNDGNTYIQLHPSSQIVNIS